jgi:hypothetical protein
MRLFVPGSKIKNFKKNDSRFFEVGSSANQMILLSRSRPVRFFWDGNSANQMILLSCSRPIRLFGAGSSANQVLGG